MPQKTIYVKKEDVEIFERAPRLLGKSLSLLISELIGRAVKNAEKRAAANNSDETVFDTATIANDNKA